MSRAAATVLTLTVLLGTALPAAAAEGEKAAAPSAAEVVPGEVLVKWRDAERGPEMARARGLAVVAELGVPAKGLPSVVSTGDRTVDAVIAELEADPAVEYAEPSYLVTLPDTEIEGGIAELDGGEGSVAAVSVNDPMTGGQYSLDRMRVRDAWAIEKGTTNVVAVLDTGVQASHPDLAGRVLAGRDFANDDSNAADDNGHGTWVSGIIAANANDGYGMAGISWSAKILPVKIMDREGRGSTADLYAGIRWAADNGADVINMSVGGFPYSQAVLDAVNYAWSKGAVLVGAAGNNNRREDYYPASYGNVINVSATQREDEFSHWSSYGPQVNVSAPGSSVMTTNCYTCTYADHDSWGSHTYISGTSFATPNVAGVVALLQARYPTWSPSQIVSRLYATVDDLGYAGFDERYGRGRVNAYRALGASVSQPARPSGDGLEGNDAAGSAKRIGLGTTTRPTIYPAGDVDWFAVDVPRGGRLDVRVTGVVDSRAYPWNKSTLPVDPVVSLYTAGGSHIKTVDAQWESGTELAQHGVNGATRILVKVNNYYANGSRGTYTITPTFVDTVRPTVTSFDPGANAQGVSRFPMVKVVFSEPVTNVTTGTVRLRDTVTGALAPASVRYDSGSRTGYLTVSSRLAAERRYAVEVTTGIRDGAGNSLSAATSPFTTGITGFADTVGSPFAYDIAWLEEAGITAGCSPSKFCPKASVTREQMASFLARGLKLPSVSHDIFTDDEGSAHEADINRLAAAKITGGCAPSRFCPTGNVTREQMASFLARALRLPAVSVDYFSDDDNSPHEADINRLAAAGVTGGCGTSAFCPRAVINREQMAAFLHRALGR